MRSSQGGFSVTWEQYGSVMCAGFQELQQRAEFVDMTIAADGHLVRVHQMVVGLASPFLKELLRSAPSPNPVLFLNNVSHKMLCCILEYMYTGEALVPADDLKTFIATGKALRVRGLEDMIEHSSEEDVVEATTSQAHTATVDAQQALVEASAYSAYQSDVIKHEEPLLLHDQQVVQLAVGNERKRPATEMLFPVNTKKLITMQSPKRECTLGVSPIPAKFMESDTQENVEEVENHFIDYMNESTQSAVEEHMHYDVDTLHKEELEQEQVHDVEELKSDEDSDQVDQQTNEDGGNVHKTPDLMFTVSNQGGIQLVLNRYLYRVRNTYKDGRRRWECVDNGRLKCTATCITMNNTLLSRFSMHNHPFHDKKILVKVKKNMVFANIKKAESLA